MKRLLFVVMMVAMSQLLVFCQSATATTGSSLVLIETPYGEIKIRLYDETPLHRDNFLKLVNQGFYDDLLFHRVINEFMIQGGDPQSRDAAPSARLGAGDPGYKIDAEIIYPQLFHKKGALAAARQGDQGNPQKRSSGSQFYIVHGKVFSPEELEQMESAMTDRQYQMLMMRYMEPFRQRFMELQQAGDREGFQALMQKISEDAAAEAEAMPSFQFSDAQREAYTTIGGTPQLDGEYTVFGEVVEGLDVIDQIAAVETGLMDRPVKDVKMKIKLIKE
ncbi:peptidylprolyl isomerase [Alkaliflexus imshenetskii]|uniref:peptidylprolyl isomerase n=1 Tax=Alkaliflexus imshenetskii TaxID=286730 RepID=UPI00047CCE5C|nr:peptidylprolyl isomerase [Alkaliflexus imshenetskii]